MSAGIGVCLWPRRRSHGVAGSDPDTFKAIFCATSGCLCAWIESPTTSLLSMGPLSHFDHRLADPTVPPPQPPSILCSIGALLAWLGVCLSFLLLQRIQRFAPICAPLRGGCESVLGRVCDSAGIPLPWLGGILFWWSWAYGWRECHRYPPRGLWLLDGSCGWGWPA